MRLRDRQREFSDRCHTALQMRGNTLGVAPTGAGKTVMLSHIVGRQKLPHGALVLQHRDELVRQNRHTFGLVNPAISTGLFTADRKEWGYGCIFAMVQTLAREDALAKMPKVDLVAVDEGHHAAADSYRRILAACHKLNPNLQTLLVSATPNRGDKKTLRGVIDNCADQITLRELIDAKHLVPPRSFVVDLGVRDQLDRVRRTASDFDMLEVEAIMDKQVLNDRVVEEWKNLAGDRQTVVFCSTVQHAEHVAEAFRAGGVAARVIDGSMPSGERARTLAAFDRCEFRVIVNVAVLTEGWDCQPVSCVILLRPSSYKSTMIQMIGRGLRKLDPERYPGRHKDDCIVIDFGTSILKHGDLEPRVNLHQGGSKECPECQSTVPAQSPECPVCNFVFPVPIVDQPDETDGNDEEEDEPDDPGAPEHLTDFRLTEIDLLIDKSPF
jgi:DNA repair protein RadD